MEPRRQHTAAASYASSVPAGIIITTPRSGERHCFEDNVQGVIVAQEKQWMVGVSGHLVEVFEHGGKNLCMISFHSPRYLIGYTCGRGLKLFSL